MNPHFPYLAYKLDLIRCLNREDLMHSLNHERLKSYSSEISILFDIAYNQIVKTGDRIHDDSGYDEDVFYKCSKVNALNIYLMPTYLM